MMSLDLPGKVCMPKELGCLGIPNLRLLNAALRARWLWLERVDGSRPWKEFAIRTTTKVREIFEAATSSRIGDGRSTLFWSDIWLEGGRICDMFPSLVKAVRPRTVASRTVREALQGT
ncbi:hypothetical protein BRADI_3g28465v3 [Brachypodium distachyon]|uniref:Reverse transcriptase zinc-binding domain-containing protein n=1 Tax=Brachypodium distachyon TaxID=15368 RepID=A0A2K2CZR4_BRADI|nr:hypothetical protein BRADI_3g28465v3 [Brachypodium distachyon]